MCVNSAEKQLITRFALIVLKIKEIKKLQNVCILFKDFSLKKKIKNKDNRTM